MQGAGTTPCISSACNHDWHHRRDYTTFLLIIHGVRLPDPYGTGAVFTLSDVCRFLI